MNNFIVYQIKNIKNGKRYIGSSINGKSRINSHVRDLNKNTHHNQLLQEDWNNYGEDCFEISLICNLYNEKMLRKFERDYILENETFKEYNIGNF